MFIGLKSPQGLLKVSSAKFSTATASKPDSARQAMYFDCEWYFG